MSEPQRLAPVEPLRRVGGVGVAATILIGVVVVLAFVSAWTTWNAYWVVDDYLAGVGGVTEADLQSADSTTAVVTMFYLFAFAVSAVVFVTWLWRARVNAELLCAAPHRRGRAWVIGGWICPVVNFWFPFMVVDDIYRASRPTNPPNLVDRRSVAGNRLLGLWWTLWLGILVLDRIVARMWSDALTLDSLRSAGVVELLLAAVTLGAALVIIPVVRQVSGWQDGRASLRGAFGA